MKTFSIIASSVIAVLIITVTTLSLIVTSALTRDTQDITNLQHRNANLTSRINGEHRDLITCGDFSNLGLQSYYLNTNAWTLDSYPVDLPRHCINR